MFAYNPTQKDRSGLIHAEGRVAAANTNAQTTIMAAETISGALTSIASEYKNSSDKKSQIAAQEGIINAVGETHGFSPAHLQSPEYLAMPDVGKLQFLAGAVNTFQTPSSVGNSNYKEVNMSAGQLFGQP